MSKLHDLIAQLCPNGVPYRQLGEIWNYLQKDTLTKAQLEEGGVYPVINSGRELYGYYSSFNNTGDAVVIASHGAYVGFVTYMPSPFWAGALCHPIRSKDTTISNRFLFHYLKTQENYIREQVADRSGVPFIKKSNLARVHIPVPPRAVQEEIARILDSFTALEAELEAELEARKKQYAYWRERLLAFRELDEAEEARA